MDPDSKRLLPPNQMVVRRDGVFIRVALMLFSSTVLARDTETDKPIALRPNEERTARAVLAGGLVL